MRNTIHLISSSMVYSALFPFFFLFVFVTSGWTQETQSSKEVTPLQPVVAEPYVYAVEGRTDPFKPFISKKATAPVGRDPNEIVEEQTELTGMQLFEPGQLNLVGVLITEGGELALVEDQTKKGYTLKRGTLIGKRGVVTQIEKEQVVITETARTRAGKEIKTTVIMRLKKEGAK